MTQIASETEAAHGERTLALLEGSHLLVALVDEGGGLHHANAALQEQLTRAAAPVAEFADLFTLWSRTKVADAALPAARRIGLWEGGLTLAQTDRAVAVHTTLVGAPGDQADNAVLALLMPHAGTSGLPAGESGDTPDLSGRLAVPLAQETRFLDLNGITHLEAHGSYTQVYAGERALLTSQPLANFAQALPDAFVRTHRSYLVNIHQVRSVIRRENRMFLRVADTAATEVPVSRRREAQVRAVLDTAQQVAHVTR
ncbi:MAG TPA: LytTR family DNA-binding domain-containing protein [Gammaproteobacteria bacterium]|nr:LytTR family DNA-binding domain-containing protein [Gammaproteobacteria bacterium]